MNIGIIIPCYNIEVAVNLSDILCVIDSYPHLHFCFVNNGSSDNTISILEYFRRESSQGTCVLDIKKKKNILSVIKAGERFLNSNEEVDYVQSISLDFKMNLDELKYVFDNQVLKEHEFYEKIFLR